MRACVLVWIVVCHFVPYVQGQCSSVNFVSREDWGARPSREVVPMPVPVNMTFIHHTEGRPCFEEAECEDRMRGTQDYHMDDRGWFDIGYNFLVGEDGRAYVGRGWDVEGGHTVGYNDVSIAVCIIGTFEDVLPLEVALDTAQQVLQCGVELGYVTPDFEMFGHRDAACKSCPGEMLYQEIQTWPNFSNRSIPVYCL